MTKSKWIASATSACLFLLILAVLFALPHKGHADRPRVIEITAKRFEFSPNVVTLKKGESVTLRLISADVTHGFFLRPLKIDTIVTPENPTDATVTPETPGTFTTICDHFCGVNHGNMKMTIVVE
jgi:cytochrome c oxidase subunit II